jgi:hypothetical protein
MAQLASLRASVGGTFEDRIGIANGVLAAGEKPAQVEVYRKDTTRYVRLVRYTAPCLICGSTVYVEAGEPDFPRRVVGRCSEAPREHVFSFDRVTLRGQALKANTSQ